jgi:hypothetical protein
MLRPECRDLRRGTWGGVWLARCDCCAVTILKACRWKLGSAFALVRERRAAAVTWAERWTRL